MLDYPWTDAPAPGAAIALAPGVLWLRMPMPMAPRHINLWAIRDRDPQTGLRGWTIVDAGLHTQETIDHWEALLSPSGALEGEPILRVVVTHLHPDHAGMAGWLTRRFDAPLSMTEREHRACCAMFDEDGREAPDDVLAFNRRAGWSDEQITRFRSRFGSFGRLIHPPPREYRVLRDGETLQIGDYAWRVVVGRGHSPEHACLHCPGLKLFISGDQVLPRTSSNVSVVPSEPDGDPIADWFDSIDRIRETVPDDVLVLPAHNLPFRGLHARLDQLATTTTSSLDALRSSLDCPRRVVDMFAPLFGRPILEYELLILATGEGQAHINHLLQRREAVACRIENGVAWYCAAAA
ncbi:MBL fold metallo-hydrolase [Azoarcus sp. DN11]|uniref:MBL fold metallo-hydrolase n=1 Tax=Azoarcus sp. DN11 TaxID=356837 RepID=UPI000EABC90E|nr:MBL fold metallo-hydrolase [Azoarcus sp. DN11]AYH43552.1 MBL fold metallo-hydrolase [Azoarcus sp. DN11]